MSACDACLRRTALIAALAGQLDVEWRRRSAPAAVLSLPDEALLGLDPSGRIARAQAEFAPDRARAAIAAAGLTVVCRCDAGYPARHRGTCKHSMCWESSHCAPGGSICLFVRSAARCPLPSPCRYICAMRLPR